jgi:hypothetical protein
MAALRVVGGGGGAAAASGGGGAGGGGAAADVANLTRIIERGNYVLERYNDVYTLLQTQVDHGTKNLAVRQFLDAFKTWWPTYESTKTFKF